MERTHTTSVAYYRRLVLIALVMLIVLGGLGTQLLRLTVVRGAEYRALAEEALEREELVPTNRGRIVDRHGEVLAQDAAGWALEVNYRVIDGAWIVQQSRFAAQAEVGKQAWLEMSAAERRRAAEAHVDTFARQRDELFEWLRMTLRADDEAFYGELDDIEERVERLVKYVHARQREQEARELGVDPETYDAFAPRPIAEQLAYHTIEIVNNQTAFALRAGLRDHPEGTFRVDHHRLREQPWAAPRTIVLDRSTLPTPLRSATPQSIEVHDVAAPLIGDLRDVWSEDVDAQPYRDPATGAIDLAGYRSEDRTGRRGLEHGFESLLRGTRGRRRKELDTGVVHETPPQPGGDLHVTIDIELQARIKALLDPTFGLTRVQKFHYPRSETPLPEGWPLAAGAVVLDVESGEILAMVSSPPEDAAWHDQVVDPLHHRAVEVPQSPGSIAKPLMFVAAVTEGVHRTYDEIECTGHYFAHEPRVARCWIYREQFGMVTHGALDARDAIARSCNIYFYTLADRLGMRAVYEWYRNFGGGRTFDLGLGRTIDVTIESDDPDVPSRVIREHVGEDAGFVPEPDAPEIGQWLASGGGRFDTVVLGIGQGRVSWTPLHAANAYAILARHGDVLDPILARHRRSARRSGHLPLDASAVEAALDGMRRSIEASYGTGHKLYVQGPDGQWNVPEAIFDGLDGVAIRGKTGTAQGPPPRFDLNRDGTVDATEAALRVDHSWYVVLAGPEDDAPKYAIAVLVEYGGSGGRAAGPIVHQIVRALQYHGYLPGGTQDATPALARP